MRRTARALSVAVLAGAVLGGGASAALADPSAEVSPGTARPGGDVSLSVSCDPVGQAAAPDSVEATSRAFDQGSVRLTHVPAADDDVSGPEYRGTARLTASAETNWSSEDLEMAADLMVTAMLNAVMELLELDRRHAEDETVILERSERQLRLITLGMNVWRSG